MLHPDKCPLCLTPSEWNEVVDDFLLRTYHCRRCGDFLIHDHLRVQLERARPTWWPRLSAWIREKKESRATPPVLAEQPEAIEGWLPNRTISEKLDLLLRIVERRTKEIGDTVNLDLESDAALVWCASKGEVVYLLASLREMRRLDPLVGGQASLGAVRLTTDGMLRLEQLAQASTHNAQIFVAMSFAPGTEPLRDLGLCAGIRLAGYVPQVMNLDPHHGERIDARIMVEIRRSKAVVADVTDPRANVMYEAGFADGLGKQVIWTVHKDRLNKQANPDGLPFDTRQFFHIPWETPQRLAAELAIALEARVGRGPNRQTGQ